MLAISARKKINLHHDVHSLNLLNHHYFQCSLFSGTFTIFAPTNAAFSKIPKATLASLEQDTQALSNILLFHVAQGRILSRDARDELTITTLNGDKVRFNIYTHNNVSTPLTCFLFN